VTWATSSEVCSATGADGRTTQRGPPARRRHGGRAAPVVPDAVHGVTTSVNVPEEVRCSNCRGTGAAPGTSTHTCPRCGGTGSLNDNQGLFSLSTVCPDCIGRGTLFDTPCPVCHGTGTERKVRSVKVRIPAGVEDGQRIRVKGRGAPGQGMAPPATSTSWSTSAHPTLRAQRAQPDHHRADHLPRGGAGYDHHGADARTAR
jgi:DnaJ-class molecular chaperone